MPQTYLVDITCIIRHRKVAHQFEFPCTASAIRKAAKRLEQLRDLPRTLMRYETHDRRLALLEGCLAWIDREWDHLVTIEEELARGK